MELSKHYKVGGPRVLRTRVAVPSLKGSTAQLLCGAQTWVAISSDSQKGPKRGFVYEILQLLNASNQLRNIFCVYIHMYFELVFKHTHTHHIITGRLNVVHESPHWNLLESE